MRSSRSLLLRTFVVNRGRGSLLADLGLTVRLVGLALARRRGRCSRSSRSAWWQLIEAVAGSEPKQEVVRAIQHSGTAARILGAVAVVVFAPVAEELLFRGLLLRGLLRRYGAPAAVLIGGVTFAAVHLVDPSSARCSRRSRWSGCCPGSWRCARGDLSRSILLHAGFNLLSAVLLLAT